MDDNKQAVIATYNDDDDDDNRLWIVWAGEGREWSVAEDGSCNASTKVVWACFINYYVWKLLGGALIV